MILSSDRENLPADSLNTQLRTISGEPRPSAEGTTPTDRMDYLYNNYIKPIPPGICFS
jgi:hypothetical protein